MGVAPGLSDQRTIEVSFVQGRVEFDSSIEAFFRPGRFAERAVNAPQVVPGRRQPRLQLDGTQERTLSRRQIALQGLDQSLQVVGQGRLRIEGKYLLQFEAGQVQFVLFDRGHGCIEVFGLEDLPGSALSFENFEVVFQTRVEGKFGSLLCVEKGEYAQLPVGSVVAVQVGGIGVQALGSLQIGLCFRFHADPVFEKGPSDVSVGPVRVLSDGIVERKERFLQVELVEVDVGLAQEPLVVIAGILRDGRPADGRGAVVEALGAGKHGCQPDCYGEEESDRFHMALFFG